MRDEIDTIRHKLAEPPTDRFDLLEDDLNRFEEWVIEGQRIMVARIENIVAEIEALSKLFEKPKPRKNACSGSFIYVVQADNGMLKIGVSTNPGARVAQLRTSSPFKLSFAYMGALRCDGYAVEAAAHETLARHRLEGEWFNCPMDMAVAAIGAAAYRLGEPIASGDPKFADEIVRMINDTAAVSKHSWPWRGIAIAIGAAMSAIIAARIADFISG